VGSALGKAQEYVDESASKLGLSCNMIRCELRMLGYSLNAMAKSLAAIYI
jgi:hypothetical protein